MSVNGRLHSVKREMLRVCPMTAEGQGFSCRASLGLVSLNFLGTIDDFAALCRLNCARRRRAIQNFDIFSIVYINSKRIDFVLGKIIGRYNVCFTVAEDNPRRGSVSSRDRVRHRRVQITNHQQFSSNGHFLFAERSRNFLLRFLLDVVG